MFEFNLNIIKFLSLTLVSTLYIFILLSSSSRIYNKFLKFFILTGSSALYIFMLLTIVNQLSKIKINPKAY